VLPFILVIVIIQGLAALALAAVSPAPFAWLMVALQPAVGVYCVTFIEPSLKGRAWDLLVGLPAGWLTATSTLSLPWALPGLLVDGPLPWWSGWWAPALLSLWGLAQTLRTGRERVELRPPPLSAAAPQAPLARGPGLQRRQPARGATPAASDPSDPSDASGALRVVQLTDPHLGPFMSTERLAAACARAVEQQPDIIVLTGDLLTLATQKDDAPLIAALAPLRAHPAVYAVFGNHDHESPALIKRALAQTGVRLLNDAQAVVPTRLGPVELVGVDFRFSDRAAAVGAVLARTPAVPAVLRLLLLHDPGMFVHVPPGRFHLTLSGHTHGGQVGLVGLGIPHTVVSAISKVPDHGPWTGPGGLLYVHRGTGHYGFPIRAGVPAEESVLEVILPASEAANAAALAPAPASP
jgi:predicted MPP superfamily phosphohydrolase